MSGFNLMQAAWEAALEGEIERSFRLADEAGVTVIDRAMARRNLTAGITAEDLAEADVKAWGEGYQEGYKVGMEEGRKLTREAVGAAVSGLNYDAKVPR